PCGAMKARTQRSFTQRATARFAAHLRAYNMQLAAASLMDTHVISEQIDKILRSQSFAGKGQLRKLLGVLARGIDSQASLSPDAVIQELWPDEIRTKRPADVATEMNRLRHALEAYYQREGKSDPIRISLPNRSAAAADGTPEKRWIVASPRDGTR